MSQNYLLRIREVSDSVGLSKATIYKMISKGQFPKPLQISDRAVAWRPDDIEVWISKLPSTVTLSLK